MIAYLDGIVIERAGDTELVLQVAGVGYRVTADARGTRVGDLLKLWIHSITGEAGTRLYGFDLPSELVPVCRMPATPQSICREAT